MARSEYSSKATPPFDGKLQGVQYLKGVQIVAKRKQPITTAHFMEVLAQTSEEVGRWKPGPETGSQEPFEPTPDHPASP